VDYEKLVALAFAAIKELKKELKKWQLIFQEKLKFLILKFLEIHLKKLHLEK
jgi:hypothetical protein